MTREMRPRITRIITKSAVAAVLLVFLAQPIWVHADTGPIQRLGNGIPTSIAASPDGKTVAVGSSIGVWFFDAATFATTGFWDTGSWVKEVQYSIDGRYLRADEKAYDVATGQVMTIELGQRAWVNHQCSFDGKLCAKYLFNGVGDLSGVGGLSLLDLYSTRILETATGNSVHMLIVPRRNPWDSRAYPPAYPQVRDVAWAPDGESLYGVSGDDQHSIVVAWNTRSWAERQSLGTPFTGALWEVAWSHDGRQVASDVSVWNVDTAHIAGVRSCHWPGVGFLCEPPQLEVALSHYANIFGPTSGQTILSFEPHHIWIISAVLDEDGTTLATSGVDSAQQCSEPSDLLTCSGSSSSTRIWSVPSGHQLANIPVLFYNVAMSPDGKLIAGHTSLGVEVWNWFTGRRVWSAPEDIGAQCSLASYGWYSWCEGNAGGLAVSPSGQYLATYAASTKTSVRLWSLATGELVTTLTGHTGEITGVAFDPTGTKVAASSADGTILVWPVP